MTSARDIIDAIREYPDPRDRPHNQPVQFYALEIERVREDLLMAGICAGLSIGAIALAMVLQSVGLCFASLACAFVAFRFHKSAAATIGRAVHETRRVRDHVRLK